MADRTHLKSYNIVKYLGQRNEHAFEALLWTGKVSFAATLSTYWALTHYTDVSFSISARFTKTPAAIFWSRLSHSFFQFLCSRRACTRSRRSLKN